jgi:hypothetical protein
MKLVSGFPARMCVVRTLILRVLRSKKACKLRFGSPSTVLQRWNTFHYISCAGYDSRDSLIPAMLGKRYSILEEQVVQMVHNAEYMIMAIVLNRI